MKKFRVKFKIKKKYNEIVRTIEIDANTVMDALNVYVDVCGERDRITKEMVEKHTEMLEFWDITDGKEVSLTNFFVQDEDVEKLEKENLDKETLEIVDNIEELTHLDE